MSKIVREITERIKENFIDRSQNVKGLLHDIFMGFIYNPPLKSIEQQNWNLKSEILGICILI
jgi:hypothetical protein